jgi:DNA-binding response OmpR family regulator
VPFDIRPYRFHTGRQVVAVHDREVALSGTQYRLAALFFTNVGRLLPREHIYAAVWGRELPAMTRTIDSHVSRLRAMLEIDTPNGFTLHPVYRTGYQLSRADLDIDLEIDLDEPQRAQAETGRASAAQPCESSA